MAYGKKKVVFDRKKRTLRSVPLEDAQGPSPTTQFWRNDISALTLANRPSHAKPSKTRTESLPRRILATKPVQYLSSPASEEFTVEELYNIEVSTDIDAPWRVAAAIQDTAVSDDMNDPWHTAAAIHDIVKPTDIDALWRTPTATHFTRQPRAQSPDLVSPTSSVSSDSFEGCGVGSVPASLMGDGSLFYPEKESFELQHQPPRSYKPHPADVGSLHSTSVPIPIGTFSEAPTYTTPAAYTSRRPAPPRSGLSTVRESYSGINYQPSFRNRQPSPAAQAAHQAREAKLSSTLGRYVSVAPPVRRSSALRREYRLPRFPPYQYEPPNPKEHGTAIQRGFPGVKPKVEPVLYVEKDEVQIWNKYREYLGELKERHHVDVGWEGKGKWWGGASCVDT